MKNNKWHYRFVQMAELVSSWSKDQSSKVGAVAVDPKTNIICGLGYNGMPRNINDDIPERHKRPNKYVWFEHAERNLIYNCSRIGVPLDNCDIYVTHFPCPDCARAIIQTGFKNIYYKNYDEDDNWKDFMKRMEAPHNISKEMFIESGVLINLLTN